MALSIAIRAEQALSLERAAKVNKEFLSESYASYKNAMLKVEHFTHEVSLGHRVGFFENPEAIEMLDIQEKFKQAAVELLHDLKSTDELDLLEQDNKALYNYMGGYEVSCHSRIGSHVIKFLLSPGYVKVYTPVIDLAQKIKKSEGHDLHSVALELSLKNLELEAKQLTCFTEIVEKDHIRNSRILEISQINLEDFEEGNFNYIADVDTKEMVERAYHFLRNSGAFAQASIPEESWDNFASANKNLSGVDVMICQRHIQSIKAKGWLEHVRAYIAYQAQ